MIEFDESANASASPEQGLSGLPNGQFIYGTPGFSKRERACIDLLYPDSGLDWLNEMIRVRKREEIARAYLLRAAEDDEKHPVALFDGPTYRGAALRAYYQADAMIAEGEKV